MTIAPSAQELGTAPEISTNLDLGAMRTAQIADHATGLVMSMLSDAYNRPQEAVLRELVANAIDAQTMNGSTRPVEIVLPDENHRQLIVTDHGIGMTEQQLLENFADYGNSTKARNSTAIGKFGIGAKSPYALTTQFSVVTTHRGLTVTALFTLGADGVPSHTVVSRVAGDRASGTTITLPISQGHHVWSEAAQNALCGLDEGTAVVHLGHVSDETVYLISRHKGREMPELSNSYGLLMRTGQRRANLIMGQMAYEIPSDMRRNYPSSLVFLADLDQIELTHTREQIKDTERNREALDHLYRAWFNEAFAEDIRRWQNATSWAQREVLLDEMSQRQRREYNREVIWDNQVNRLFLAGLSPTPDRNYPQWSLVGDLQGVDYLPGKSRSEYHLSDHTMIQAMVNDNSLLVVGDTGVIQDKTALRRFADAIKVARIDRPDLAALVVEREALEARFVTHQELPLFAEGDLELIDFDQFIADHRPKKARTEASTAKFIQFFAARPAHPLGTPFNNIAPNRVLPRKDEHSIDTEDLRAAVAATSGKTLVLCGRAEFDTYFENFRVLAPGSRGHMGAALADRISDAVFINNPRRSAKRLAAETGAEQIVGFAEWVRLCCVEFVAGLDDDGRITLARRARCENLLDSMTTLDAIPHPQLRAYVDWYTDGASSTTAHRWAHRVLSLANIGGMDLPDPGPGFDQRFPLVTELYRVVSRANNCTSSTSVTPELLTAVVEADLANGSTFDRF